MLQEDILSAIKENLEGNGINCKNVKRFNPDKEGFIKLDPELAQQLDQVMKIIPNILHYDDVIDSYKVIYDKGIGVLQKSVKHPGYFLTNVVEKGTNNQIKEVAVLGEIGNINQILSSSFSLLSIAVGQYYMKEINSKIDSIEARLSSIETFLKDDKKSVLFSEEQFVAKVADNLPFIIENEVQRQATIVSLQKIEIDAKAQMALYKMQLERFDLSNSKKDKPNEALKNALDILELVSEYWYSLYIYSAASSLEPVISSNTNEAYLDKTTEDLASECLDFKKFVNSWKPALQDYVDTLKSLDNNKLLETIKKLKDVDLRWGNLLLGWKLVGLGADLLNENDKKKKSEWREIINEKINNSLVEDISPIEEKINDLIKYNAFYNKPIEIVKYKGDIYIKTSIEPESSLENETEGACK